MNTRSSRAAAAMLLAGALLLATACGGPDTAGVGGSGRGGFGRSGAPSATANDINPMPRDRLRDGGTFTWPLDEMPADFNLNELDGNLQTGMWAVTGSLLPVAYNNDAAGVPVWNPDLLASEPTLVTEPQQVVTYEINPKAVWYDGTPITWQDFYWQWKALNGTNPAYRITSANGFENIESVERGKDDREVVVTYARPFADWQSLFFPLYPASTNKDPAIFNDGWREKPLTTAGPFKLASIDRTTKTITLVRNEKWWGEPAKLDRVVFRVIVPDAQIDALANGEVDAVDIGSNASMYLRASQIEGVDVRVAGGPNFSHLTINGTSPNLSDVRVRRALAMGIDRAAIARALIGPLGLDPQPLGNHVFMLNQEGYRDDSGEVGTYDPSKAAALLDEAGWKLDGGVRKKDGRPLEIDAVIPAATQSSRQIVELVQNMLGQIGVRVNIDAAPGDDFFDKYVKAGQYDITVFAWMGTPYPISSVKSIYAMPTKNADGTVNIQQNFARIGSAELDEAFLRAGAEFDRAKAQELANEADAMIWQEVHSITLYQRPDVVPTKKGLANFGAFGFQTPWPYQDIGWVAEPESPQ
ncbi:MAG TPA: ABC transporter family substrate-binding protein [Gammaproteobacteria bacterium]|nr:ABC transporter family substrate-binding protein [Gammaproteobacteria bacterium]